MDISDLNNMTQNKTIASSVCDKQHMPQNY